jgi:ATP-dependent RNA helicase DDX55/SPB4
LEVIGGHNKEDDIRAFRKFGANVVVATPGRLCELMHVLVDFNVRTLEVLVLDEADRLLEMGFQATLNSIFLKLPKQRRTGLFSATQTNKVCVHMCTCDAHTRTHTHTHTHTHTQTN